MEQPPEKDPHGYAALGGYIAFILWFGFVIIVVNVIEYIVSGGTK